MNVKNEHSPFVDRKVFRDQLVTIGDLDNFKRDLLLALKNLVAESKASGGKKWLKSYEVKKLLQISTGTLQALRKNGTVPFTKIGRIIYYSQEDIDKLLSQMQNKHRRIPLTRS